MNGMNGPLKWHGGKHYLAKRIIGLMPPHTHYVEPYAGGLSVLLAKEPEGVSEVVNDLNAHLTNFWKVLQSPSLFPEFKRRVEAIPFSRNEYDNACLGLVGYPPSEVADAANFFVVCRQSLAGRMTDFTPVCRNRVRRGMNANVSEWLGAIDGLSDVHARLQRVLIENLPALDLIRREDTSHTLFYLDPPYLHETRESKNAYQVEMSDREHLELLEALQGLKGKVLLSGYRSPLYDDKLPGWKRYDFELPNNASGGKEKRRMTECVWTNF